MSETTEMHRNIYELDEIMRTICQYCDKPSLACLARTNKAISEPALDILWETLASFNQVLRLLPDELISWRPNDWGVLVPIINRLIIPRDWARFNFYAQRIKQWTLEDLQHVEESIVDHIAFGRIPGHIFPRLTHIAIMGSTVPAIHLQTLLLCPSLQNVTIWNFTPSGGATKAMTTLLKTLADKAPSLKNIVVQWGPVYTGVPHADGVAGSASLKDSSIKDGLTDLYTHSSSLQTIHMGSVGCVSPISLKHLSSLPALTSLHMNIYGIQDVNELFSSVFSTAYTDSSSGAETPWCFPDLEDFSLSGEVDDFVTIMSHFPNRRLVNVAFSVRTYPRSKVLIALFNALATSFPNTLRSLKFTAPREELDGPASVRAISFSPEQYNHTATLLHPLLAIHELVTVHIELGVPLHLTDEDLRDIGNSWKYIEKLNLCSDPYCDRTRGVKPNLTVRGLFSLLASCPRLQYLGLYIDYTTGLDPSVILYAMPSMESNHARQRGSSVTVFDAGRSWILNPSLVAALLSGILPNLKVFRWSGMAESTTGHLQNQWNVDDNGVNNDGGLPFEGLNGFRFLNHLSASHTPGWKHVYELLPVFYAVRENERRVLMHAQSMNGNIVTE